MADTKDAANDEKILELARRRFRQGQQALKDQLQRELDDLTFEFEPWTEEAIRQRSGGTVGNIALPPRPMLKIPTLDQPLQLVENQEKAAHLEPQIHPEGEDANDETADILQSIYRDIEEKSRAHIARDWAFRRKIRCGRGWWRVNKVWADEVDDGPGVFDQKITIDRILNQASVTPDPSAQQPDWSDGQWAFIGGFKPIDDINAEYGKDDDDWEDITDETFAGLGDDIPQWYSNEDGVKCCRITEYFTIETTKRTVKVGGRERVKDDKRVLWYKLVSDRILEREIWDGPDIPLIPDIGRESNINGKRRWEGIISKAKDAVRLVNWSATTAVEKMAAGMISPLMMAEGQQEGHESELQQANTRMFPYMLYRPTLGPNGELLPPPVRNLQGPDLSSDMMLMAQAKDFVSAATFVYDPGKGKVDSHRSGKAVQALQNQMDEGNSNYLDDFAQIAVTREAQIVLGLIPKIYDRPGRLVQILGKDDEISQVILNQPYTQGENGKPTPMQEGMPAPMGPQGKPLPVKHYDLNKGRYAVTVSVGKSYQTRRQQGADQLGQLLGNIPQVFPVLGWRYVKSLDFPGSQDAAQDLKKLMPPQLKDENQPDPQAMQAQMGQMQQHLQLMQHVITQQQQVIETKQVEQQGKKDLAQMQAVADASTADKDRAAKIYIAELGAKVDRLQVMYEALRDTTNLAHEHAHAVAAAGHDEHMATLQQQHDAAMAAAGAGAQADQADQSHQHALEQGQQAAELAPEPAPTGEAGA